MLSVHHAVLPHTPYQYTVSGPGTRRDRLPGLSAEQWTQDPAPVRTGAAALPDAARPGRQAGRRARRTTEANRPLRPRLVVVAADHGVSFRAGDSRRNVGAKNIREIAGVPMLIKAPGKRRGRIVDSAATTEDILPTIGSYLGARWSSGGRSLENESGSTKVTVAGEDGPVTVSLGEFIRLRNQAADRIVELNR